MKILLLVSAFNGLSQRAWCMLREAGHSVSVELALDEATMIKGAEVANPDLIICPFLKDRVPEQVWGTWRTIIVHPGPVGDRGPSSLDWAIMQRRPVWGVTALQAVDEMDAGPVWAHRVFPMPADPVRKSQLYNGPVADAALACIQEVVEKTADRSFVPTPLEAAALPVPGTGLLPAMRQADRTFGWHAGTADIVRRIRAADGSPGVRVSLAGRLVHVFDAHPAARRVGRRSVAGTILARSDDAVEVATGDGSVWIGHLREVTTDGPSVKLPATTVLADRLTGVPYTPRVGPALAYYRQLGEVGEIRLQAYNGALSTAQCHRVYAALRHALAQPTRVLVLRGADGVFCNGIHLNTIAAAPDPAAEAWENIRAINKVCRLLLGERRQLLITAFDGGAGAGGVMLGLTGDVVVARDGVVLNPYYDMGLTGSELHTFTLPRRVGTHQAQHLLEARLPVNAHQAAAMGLVDELGPAPAAAFEGWLAQLAALYTTNPIASAARQNRQGLDHELAAAEAWELTQMNRDMFDDRQGFAAARTAFVEKRRPDQTPRRLATHYS